MFCTVLRCSPVALAPLLVVLCCCTFLVGLHFHSVGWLQHSRQSMVSLVHFQGLRWGWGFPERVCNASVRASAALMKACAVSQRADAAPKWAYAVSKRVSAASMRGSAVPKRVSIHTKGPAGLTQLSAMGLRCRDTTLLPRAQRLGHTRARNVVPVA